MDSNKKQRGKRMEKANHFKRNPQEYDQWRPTYTRGLFDKILRVGKKGKYSLAMEVGSGAGQATLPFLKRGYQVIAIEQDKGLSNFTKNKFKGYPNFSVETGRFEELKDFNEKIDLLYSGSAFHRVDEKVAYQKAFEVLKPKGLIALFWSSPRISKENRRLYEKLIEVNQKYQIKINKEEMGVKERTLEIPKKLEGQGFQPVNISFFTKERLLTGREYKQLLETYPDHLQVGENKKQNFYQEVEEIIAQYGDRIILEDDMDLYLAAKP